MNLEILEFHTYDDFIFVTSVTYLSRVKNSISTIREDADGPRR
jgi:hypothetical protein